MPFTFAHPVIVLPFLKNKKMSATALVVGSLEYFFRMSTVGKMGHSFSGIFLIDFPLGFIVIMAFHEIIKKPLIDNLPIFFQKRLQFLRGTDWFDYFKNNVIVVFVSFFLGAVSHIFLDSMTHYDGYLVNRIAFLNVAVYSYTVYELAQYLGSIVGLVVIFFYIYKQPVQQVFSEKINLNYWFSLFGLSSIIFGLRFSFGSSLIEIGTFIVSVIFSVILAATIISFFFRERKII